MPTIELQNYVLNVVLKKLSVPPLPIIDPDQVIVQFDSGDVRSPIRQSVLQTSFTNDQHIDAQLMSNQLNPDYNQKGFKLTIYEKDENDNRAGVVGQCVCDWEMTKPEEWSNGPYERTCQLYKDGEFAGTVTLNICATKKCQDPSSPQDSSKPLLQTDGKLTIFEELKLNLNPKDVFFVVGDPPNIAGGDSNPLSSCKQGDPCRFDTDLSRYRVVQGRLVKDFSIVKDCENNDCCALGNLFEEFKDIFQKNPPEPSSGCSSTASESVDKFTGRESDNMSKSEDAYKNSSEDAYIHKPEGSYIGCQGDKWEDSPCGVIFGPMSKRTVEYKKGKKASSSTSVHMPDCPVNRVKHRPSKRSETVCCSRSCSDTITTKSVPSTSCPSTTRGAPRNVNSLVNRIVSNAKRCQDEQVPPRTCSAPKLIKSDFQIFPKSCPICCEDISWLQPQAPCPKCGFKSKAGLSIEMTSYNENQTAKEVLAKWKSDVEKHKKKKDINPLGVCLCYKNKECINCQIRRTSYKPKEGLLDNVANQLSVQNAVARLAESEKIKQEVCRKNMVSRIVDEVLGQPLKRPTMDIEKLLMKRDTEPDMAKAIRWVKNQLPKRKKLLDSASEVSERSRSSLLKILHRGAEDSGDEKTKKENEKKEKTKKYEKKSKINTKNRQDDTLHQCQARYFEYCKRRDRYPPRVFGHYYCNPTMKPVPKNMGWHWNIDLQGERRGYRPGAIYKKTQKIMDYFKEQKAAAIEMAQRKRCELMAAKKLEKPKETERPHVHVKKQNGQYIVTAYPLCDPNLPPSERTEKMLPIEFTITRADESVKRQQVKDYFRFLDQMRLNPCSFDTDSENEQITRAVNNLRDLLRTETLRSILQCDSESEGSMEIDIGGGIVEKIKNKEDIGVQIEDDLYNPIQIPSRKCMFYKNPFNHACTGPFDEMPSDQEFKPTGKVSKKKPTRPFIPPDRPYRPKPPATQPKRKVIVDQEEKKKTSKKPFIRVPPRVDPKEEKEKKEKEKEKKEKNKGDQDVSKETKLGEKKKPKRPPNDTYVTPLEPEIMPPGKGELIDPGKKKRPSKKRPTRKSETLESPDVEDHHSAKRPSAIMPPHFEKKEPKRSFQGKGSGKDKKKSVPLPPVVVPPKRPSLKPRTKGRDLFEYNPSLSKRSPIKPCIWQEVCRPSPLTTVKFLAHDCKDNCEWETQPQEYSYMNMNMNHCPNRNLADTLPFDFTRKV